MTYRRPQNVSSSQLTRLVAITPFNGSSSRTSQSKLADSGTHGMRMKVAPRVPAASPLSRSKVTKGASPSWRTPAVVPISARLRAERCSRPFLTGHRQRLMPYADLGVDSPAARMGTLSDVEQAPTEGEMIQRIHGVNVAVKELEAAVNTYRRFSGQEPRPLERKDFAFPGLR